jgi:hypothetical protein
MEALIQSEVFFFVGKVLTYIFTYVYGGYIENIPNFTVAIKRRRGVVAP